METNVGSQVFLKVRDRGYTSPDYRYEVLQ